jgi:hypothetical protein
MSLNGMVPPCSRPASDKLAGGVKDNGARLALLRRPVGPYIWVISGFCHAGLECPVFPRGMLVVGFSRVRRLLEPALAD